MKKRRVLALLLTLSLAVSTNDMTVLATEGDMSAAYVTIEETDSDTMESGDPTDDRQPGDSVEDGESDGQDQGEISGGEDNSDHSAEGGDEQDQDADDADNPDIGTDDILGDIEDTLTPDDEIDSLNPGETGEEVEVDEEDSAYDVPEVRMVTFTDDTGLKITYNANAAQQYIYTVQDGVLTKVENLTGGDVTFTGNVELTQPDEGEQYTSIAASIFAGNTNITYVKLPVGVTDITAGSFKGCTALKGVYLPSTVTNIGVSAFETCTAMTQIAVPKTVDSIGNSAFKGDARLYMVYMKDVDYSSLKSIGDNAFDGCSVLVDFCSDTEFYLPKSITNIGAYAFNNCKSIVKVDLDTAGLESMGQYAFAGCTGLTDAVMSRSLETIPQHAFDGCTALAALTFTSMTGKKIIIDEYAFYGCYGLKQLVLPSRIEKVANHAFDGCRNLNRIEVKNDELDIGDTQAFPVGDTKNTLLFVGDENSTIHIYFSVNQDKNVAFEKTNARNYYQYTVEDNNGNPHTDGKITGGQIWIGPLSSSDYNNNINKLNGGKGVENNDEVKYCIYYKPEKGYSLVAGSVRANGIIVQPEKGYYYVTMPLGGIVLTAEFRKDNDSENVMGQKNDITVEFSNGKLIKSGDENLGVEIKVGQTTRMFLIDKSGEPVSSSKIKAITSDATSVAKVSNAGVITAIKKGTAKITVTLTGGDGIDFVITKLISVVEAEVDTIKLKATTYNTTFFTLSGDSDGIQTASINKNLVASEGQSITLKANAYTSDKEGIAKELTWKSSDTRIAKVKSASTTSADASNIVEIPAGCEGEATITVTAKNAGDTARPTVTQKFVISVQNRTAKLAYSSIKVNPNLDEGGELEIIPSYNTDINPKQTQLYEKTKNSQGQIEFADDVDFTITYKERADSKSYCYSVNPMRDLKEGTYTVYVGFNKVKPNESNVLPLKITVKKAVPSPTVKFNTKKTKFNLFYKNGGTDKDGNPITVTTEITKLGTVKIKEVKLIALSAKEDDQKFLDNFEIVDDPVGLEKGIVTIRRKDGNLQYTDTKDKQAVVTGYLVIYYEGYHDDVAKKVKVTMPTVTTAPTYVLDRTSVTYNTITSGGQQERLTLLDKKTKQPIELSEDKFDISVESDKAAIDPNNCEIEDGSIAFTVDYPDSCNAKFILRNDSEWDRDKNGNPRKLSYTFKVKTSSKEPTIKTDRNTITVDASYPENAASFELVSNQRDTVLDADQIFDYNHKAKNSAEYAKMDVNYSGGKGTVTINDSSVKPGTYTWTCANPASSNRVLTKKVTLTIKVVKSRPTVKLGKGSLSLNLAAKGNAGYTEKTEIPIKITGQPDGYELDTNVNTDEEGLDCTTIVCTTKNQAGLEDAFEWTLEDVQLVDGKLVDGKLAVRLNGYVAAKTYSFKMTLRYVNGDAANGVKAKPVTFNVKVYNNSDISLSLSAKGKLNLVDREGEYTTKNTIIYTPTLKNVRGAIIDAKIYDVGAGFDSESKYFDIELNKENGKLYVTPKKTGDSESGYQYAELDNNKPYSVYIRVDVEGYDGRDARGGIWSKAINITTAQTLPKVTINKSVLDVYLSKKNYDATFVVTPQSGSPGEIENIQFGEKDEVSRDAFDITYEKQADGSLKVIIHLKDAVAFACDSTNKVKMYVKFKGQGTNTAGTAITMNVKINK
ncbi:MAG: leucine-rich repeat protein [Lachnospiraceae bacterium]|nr:leucine-rich repeat protein [Lachnospiraceae bacterium]